MTWDDVFLTEDQRDVRDMVHEWRESLTPINTDDDADAVEAARAGMVELGVWSIGMPEALGGGGAGLDLLLVALAGVAGRSAALAWACAQAHSAAEVLADAPGAGDLPARIASGEQTVAVVDRASAASRITIAEGRVSGSFARVDAAAANPGLLILDTGGTAWLLDAGALRLSQPHRRTGFAGARTSSVEIDGTAVRIEAVDIAGVMSRLRLAGAAIAAGVALDAAGLAADYASSRVQFGAPLTSLPTVRSSLENQRHLAAEALTLAMGDDGSSLSRAAATLTGNLSRAVDVASAALQSHGGYGYIEEYGAARLLRDTVSLRAAVAVL